MEVNVRPFGILRRARPGHDPKEPSRLEVPDGACVADLAVPLEVPREWVVLAVVNGEVSRPDRILQDGDQGQIFPPVAGGSPARPLPPRSLPA
ncbi:MAG: MoaD/ThiS family protein [Anaerolineales bacterium]|jgi:molybdopterin converting factor small subunit